MTTTRRRFLTGVFTAAGAASARRAGAQPAPGGRLPYPGSPWEHAPSTPRSASVAADLAQHEHHGPPRPPGPSPVGATGLPPGIVPVETPDIPKLPWRWENGAKVFELRAEPVRTEFMPGRIVDAWGFNGSVPGPTIEVVQGDRLRFIVENRLPEQFAIHWHGLEVPIGMDGVPGISQDPIPPGGRFVYEFTVHQHGTFFYHSHFAMQELMGLIGLFIIHPREPYRPLVQRDFGIVLQGWAILPNNTVPNTLSMEFNWLTFNGKAGPATTPLLVKRGERVRIRLVNLSMDHHPVHLHGNTFSVTGTEAGRLPRTQWEPSNTVLVGVAQARDVEFDAIYPGDWMLHCHLPHHMMNQMISMVGPISHVGHGLHANLAMTRGMGVVGGAALGEANGPALGRAIAAAGGFERPMPNQPLTPEAAALVAAQPAHAHPTQEDPWKVPGYPQDMFMPMDELVAKPETYGLRPGWSGAMMGMMTLVRVLEPDLFDRIQQLRAEQARRAAR